MTSFPTLPPGTEGTLIRAEGDGVWVMTAAEAMNAAGENEDVARPIVDVASGKAAEARAGDGAGVTFTFRAIASDEDFEKEVCATMGELRRDVIHPDPKEAGIWRWAEEVAVRFVVDEAREEFEASGKSLRAWLAADLADRIGNQLVAMAGDVAPSEADYREARDNLRLAPRIAARLRRIAEGAAA